MTSLTEKRPHQREIYRSTKVHAINRCKSDVARKLTAHDSLHKKNNTYHWQAICEK